MWDVPSKQYSRIFHNISVSDDSCLGDWKVGLRTLLMKFVLVLNIGVAISCGVA